MNLPAFYPGYRSLVWYFWRALKMIKYFFIFIGFISCSLWKYMYFHILCNDVFIANTYIIEWLKISHTKNKIKIFYLICKWIFVPQLYIYIYILFLHFFIMAMAFFISHIRLFSVLYVYRWITSILFLGLNIFS